MNCSKEILLFEEEERLAGFDAVKAFLALALADGAFEHITSYEDILNIKEEDIKRCGGQVDLKIRKELLKKYVMREASHVFDLDARPLCYGTLSQTFQKVLRHCGYLRQWISTLDSGLQS